MPKKNEKSSYVWQFYLFCSANFGTYDFSPKKPSNILLEGKNDKGPIYGHLVVLVNFVSKIGPFNLQ